MLFTASPHKENFQNNLALKGFTWNSLVIIKIIIIRPYMVKIFIVIMSFVKLTEYLLRFSLIGEKTVYIMLTQISS